jgi:hypothetical protein
MEQMCVASTCQGKNENYENLRGCKAPFILRSGAITSDPCSITRSQSSVVRHLPCARASALAGEMPVARPRAKEG